MPDAYIAHLFPAGGLPHPLFQTVRRACRTPLAAKRLPTGPTRRSRPGLISKTTIFFRLFSCSAYIIAQRPLDVKYLFFIA